MREKERGERKREMRSVNYDQKLKHFSHHHPLDLFHVQHDQQEALRLASCSACRFPPSGWIYICRTCNYILHVFCSQMSQVLHHPSHTNHPLTLLSSPAYPQALFKCDACGSQGNGFCYHCSDCNFDLHTFCTYMPLFINHHAHPHHLTLTFKPPYANKQFSCDICRGLMGPKHWLYRCASCEFDAHLDCAVGISRSVTETQIQRPQLPLQHHHCFPGATHPHVSAAGGLSSGPQHLDYYMHSPKMGVPGQTGSGSTLVNALIHGLVQGGAQEVGQNVMQSIMGGSSSG